MATEADNDSRDGEQWFQCRDGRRVSVRRLRRGDGPVLQRFNAALDQRSLGFFRPHSYDDETVSRLLDRSERGADFTAGVFDGDIMVGYFFLWYFTDLVPLLGIGLHDRCQGQGLGRQMLAYLISAARENGNAGIELVTMPENQIAFELYRKMGFKYVGEVENIAGDGRTVTERAMFLELQPGAPRFQREYRPPV